MRFDLNVVVGKTPGELRLVNTGKVLLRSIKVGDEHPILQGWELPVLSETLKTPAAVAEARMQLLNDYSFSGLAPMLRALRQGVRSAQLSQRRWNGCPVHIVSAAWPENAAIPPAAPECARPHFQIRQCAFSWTPRPCGLTA